MYTKDEPECVVVTKVDATTSSCSLRSLPCPLAPIVELRQPLGEVTVALLIGQVVYQNNTW